MSKQIISGVYCIENTLDGQKYVGQSVDIYARWHVHSTKLNGNRHPNIHLQNAWNKYGEDAFSFYILEQCNQSSLFDREMYWIDKFDSFNNGYNKTAGGEGCFGYVHNDKNKKKMSDIKLSYFQDVDNRKKLSEAHEFESIPIYQIDFYGNILKEWPSANWAAKSLGFNPTRIYEALNHRNRKKTYANYIWIYVDKYDINTFDLSWYISRNIVHKSFYQYDKDLNPIAKWNSVNDAEKAGFDREGIYRCCNHTHKTHRGYIFSYEPLTEGREIVDGECKGNG